MNTSESVLILTAESLRVASFHTSIHHECSISHRMINEMAARLCHSGLVSTNPLPPSALWQLSKRPILQWERVDPSVGRPTAHIWHHVKTWHSLAEWHWLFHTQKHTHMHTYVHTYNGDKIETKKEVGSLRGLWKSSVRMYLSVFKDMCVCVDWLGIVGTVCEAGLCICERQDGRWEEEKKC